MMKKQIPKSEAMQIIQGDDVESYPYLVLNKRGETAVAEWVKDTAAEPENHNIAAWFAEVGNALMNTGLDESCVIEMPRYQTESKNPETLRLGEDCFDWYIDESSTHAPPEGRASETRTTKWR
jgi:hypothetical protein